MDWLGFESGRLGCFCVRDHCGYLSAQIHMFGSADQITFDDFIYREMFYRREHSSPFLFSNGDLQMVFTFSISLNLFENIREAGLRITILRMWKLCR